MPLPNAVINRLYEELSELEQEFTIEHEGKPLKTTDCYYLGTDPLHVLFNMNCSDELREKVNAIVSKYMQEESGPLG